MSLPARSDSRSPSPEQLRLMVLASRLYHVHGLRQRAIGERLGISQARVSRLLQQAEAHGIVRTVVAVPEGLHPDLEESVEQKFGLLEVHVLDVDPVVEDLPVVLGRAAAHYLAETTLSAEIVGFTSWSRTLQEMAFAMPAASRPVTRQVVEMLGDLGSPLLQHSAARATQAMADALGAEPVFLRTPGVVATPELRRTALVDPHVRRALSLLDHVEIAFIGVGPAGVHSQLAAGDSYFTPDQLAQAQAAGAVGQLNQRLLEASGQPLSTPLDDLVVGGTLDQIRRARRRVVVAGGAEKQVAIGAALRGGWVDVLVTDATTARVLIADTEMTEPIAPKPLPGLSISG